MLQLGSNACQILPWVIRNKKSNNMKFIRCFVLEIEVKLTKGHWPFLQGVKFSSWSDFDENGLKLIGLPRWFRKKYSFAYLGSQEVCESRGQRSMPMYDVWPLNFDPLLTKMGTLKVCETIHFLNLHGNLINLSPFSLKSDELENMTSVQKVNDLFLFWPLSWERNVVWILYNWFFAP